MNKEIEDMINELVQIVERELGQQLPSDMAGRIKSAICENYGGERLYVPKLPKLVAQVRIAALGTGMSPQEVAETVGITVRHIRRIRR